jgi:hypothetical protein
LIVPEFGNRLASVSGIVVSVAVIADAREL